MNENSEQLIAEATRVFNASKGFIESGYRTVHDIPKRTEDIKRTIASRQEEADQARARYYRALDEDVDKDTLSDLGEEDSRAHWRAFDARELLGGASVDVEYQKAVARQIGGLVREQATQKLKDILSQSNDPRLRSVIEEQKEEISRGAYHLIQTFPPASEMLSSEVRKALTEASKIVRF